MAKSTKVSSGIVAQLRERYGQDSVFLLSESTTIAVDVIPTGSIGLNSALGVGGYPRGRVIEILGNPSSGKTTLTLHAIAEAQRIGLACLFIDAEHALDAIYASSLGVDLDKLVVCQPDSAEQALDILVDSARSGEFGLMVVDSVAALSPIKEIDGESGDAHVGLMARLMSQALRRISGVLRKTNTALIFINQYRSNIGVIGYGPTKTTPGGKALEFYATIRLDVQRVQTIGSGNEATANKTKVIVKKNKVAAPYRVAEFEIVFGKGVSSEGELIDAAIASGLIKKSGAWFKNAEGETICQGKEALRTILENDRDMFNSLMGQIDLGSLSGYGGGFDE
jgi:recombination protein RecA